MLYFLFLTPWGYATMAYVIGFFVCLPIAYRWCIEGYDYGGQNRVYNGSAAVGFALVWFIFLPAYYMSRRNKPRKPGLRSLSL